VLYFALPEGNAEEMGIQYAQIMHI
jgi:hypothetical protein